MFLYKSSFRTDQPIEYSAKEICKFIKILEGGKNMLKQTYCFPRFFEFPKRFVRGLETHLLHLNESSSNTRNIDCYAHQSFIPPLAPLTEPSGRNILAILDHLFVLAGFWRLLKCCTGREWILSGEFRKFKCRTCSAS